MMNAYSYKCHVRRFYDNVFRSRMLAESSALAELAALNNVYINIFKMDDVSIMECHLCRIAT